MSGPWEKYTTPSGKPWEKYGAATSVAAPAAAPGADLSQKVEGAMEAIVNPAVAGVTGLVGRAGGLIGGLAGAVATGKIGTPEGAAEVARTAEEGAQKTTLTLPTGAKGREYQENIARAVEATKLEGLGPTESMALGRTPARQAASTARQAVEPEISSLKSLPGKVADVVTPSPSPEVLRLAKKAEELGIELRPDMLADNRIAKFIGEALEQVPMSGSKAEQRQIAFNSALGKLIGADTRAKRITPDVFDKAMTQSGEKIGEIAAENPVPMPGAFASSLADFTKKVGQFETADTARIVNNRVEQLIQASREGGGRILGERFRKINSEIGAQARRTDNGDLKHALGELQEIMGDALEAQINNPARLEELRTARFQYRMGKIIEPLVAKAKGGDISPQGLMARVTSDAEGKTMMARGRGGEIGDLARIGQAFLKEPASSGTGERQLSYSLLGSLANDAKVAALVGPANAYNRLGPKLTKRALNMRSLDPAAAQPQNFLIPTP